MMRTSLPFLLAALAAGCRGPECHGELDSDAILRLQRAVQAGRDPCPEHLHPSIETKKASVSLNSKLLIRDVPTGAGVTRIEPLFRALKSDREIWKQVHPGETFQAEPRVSIDPESDVMFGASTLATAAFAGYPYLHVKSGATSVDFVYDVPGPPSPEPVEHERLDVDWAEPQHFNLRFWRGTAIINEVDARLLDQVPDVVADWCAHQKRIDTLALHPRGSFLVAATLLERIFARPELGPRKPAVRFDLRK